MSWRIAALTLAAGRSTRSGAINKLLVTLDGQPVIARVVNTLMSSPVAPIVVVTGHESNRIKQVLESYDVQLVHNSDYAKGMSTSLQRGIEVLPASIDGLLVCLGDMPWVTHSHIERIIAHFDPEAERSICVPTFDGRRGNPVLWASRFLPEMSLLSGDTGARSLVAAHENAVCQVDMNDDAVLLDIDTSEDFAAALLQRANTTAGRRTRS
ncbi:MAG: NTP transferase domain-containing protein [Acidiferrobacterales bacterium]